MKKKILGMIVTACGIISALPEHDIAALEQRYDAVIFQWYRPGTRY